MIAHDLVWRNLRLAAYVIIFVGITFRFSISFRNWISQVTSLHPLELKWNKKE